LTGPSAGLLEINMWFIVLGVLLIVMKLADFGIVATWSWWVVLAPFGLALVWWAYADSSGYTKRKEMDKLEEKKRERRRKALDALGIDRASQKRGEAAERARRAAANRVEGTRTATREHNEKVVRDSDFDSKSQTGFGEDEAERKR
jgi:small Trp-rich protein